MTSSNIEEVERIYATGDSRSDHIDLIHKTTRIRRMYEDNYYKHPFYPCIRDRGKDDEIIRWGCEIHREVHNIHFDTIIHHMLFFEPEKHKEYILNILKVVNRYSS